MYSMAPWGYYPWAKGSIVVDALGAVGRVRSGCPGSDPVQPDDQLAIHAAVSCVSMMAQFLSGGKPAACRIAPGCGDRKREKN